MLDLELDLEADLGIDTVKQAELFAAFRSIYNIPRDEDLKLRDYPTLAHVIRFVQEKRPILRPLSLRTGGRQSRRSRYANPRRLRRRLRLPFHMSRPVEVAPAAMVVDNAAIQETVLGIVAEKTGYPKEMLDLDLDLEADLGIDTVKQAEMFAAVRERTTFRATRT